MRFLRMWVDWHIGWHQGRAEGWESRAKRSRARERRWRQERARYFPNRYRTEATP